MLDVFNQDPFSFIQLTDEISRFDYQAGAVDSLIDWQDRGVLSTTVAVEEVVANVEVIHSSLRCGPRQGMQDRVRNLRSLQIPHFAMRKIITPCEVQGQSGDFGQSLKNAQSIVSQKLEQMSWNLDATLTSLRLSALTGVVKDADGNTLVDLATELGVTMPADVGFNFTTLDAASFRTALNQVVQARASDLIGVNPRNWLIIAGNDWFNKAGELQDGSNGMFFTDELCAFGSMRFGCYRIVNDSTYIGGTAAIAADEAYMVPVGIPGMFQTYYATADYWSSVNEVGRPRYARLFTDPEDRFVTIESQTNALPMIARPEAITKLLDV